MYHTEFADNGMQKMSVLPIRLGTIFFWKFVIAALVLCVVVAVEMAALTGCGIYWFPDYAFDPAAVCQTAIFQIVVTLPTSCSCWSSPPPAGICGYLSESV